jgi:hypothetical protein
MKNAVVLAERINSRVVGNLEVVGTHDHEISTDEVGLSEVISARGIDSGRITSDSETTQLGDRWDYPRHPQRFNGSVPNWGAKLTLCQTETHRSDSAKNCQLQQRLDSTSGYRKQLRL